MSDLLRKVDARTKLAGTNKLEILLFSLGQDQRTGRKEEFGINVISRRGSKPRCCGSMRCDAFGSETGSPT